MERCSSDGLLIFYGPVNVVELGRELRNSVILHCFLWEALRVVCTIGPKLPGLTMHDSVNSHCRVCLCLVTGNLIFLNH